MPLSKIVANSIADDTITTDQIADTSVHGRRNLIINGAMNVYQRGTTTTYQNNGGYDVDRFSYRRSGSISTTTFDVSQQDTTGLPEFPKCIEVKVQDAAMSDPNSINSARNCIQVNTEGQDLQLLQYATATAKPFTVSFYVKSSVAGTYCWAVDAIDSLDSYIEEYTINAADTWEYKSFTVPAPTTSQVNTAIPNDTTTGLNIQWTGYGNVTGASDHRGVTGWQSYSSGTNKLYTANQTNAFTAVNNTFSLTGVQLEIGEQATPFEHRSFGDELARCQRYFQRLQDPTLRGVMTGGTNGGASRLAIPTYTKLRANPSISMSGTFNFWNGGDVYTGSASSGIFVAPDGYEIDITINTASNTTKGMAAVSYTTNSTTKIIDLDAEI